MTYKLIALSAALAAGVALPVLADRGNTGPFGMGMGPRGMGPSEAPSFAELDADGDGNVSPAEFLAHRQGKFDAIDSNGDGEVSADELTDAQMARMQERIATGIKTMIEFRDQDGNGTLSVEELQESRRGPGPEAMFNRLDADNDGLVSEQEMTAATERMHSRRDGAEPFRHDRRDMQSGRNDQQGHRGFEQRGEQFAQNGAGACMTGGQSERMGPRGGHNGEVPGAMHGNQAGPGARMGDAPMGPRSSECAPR